MSRRSFLPRGVGCRVTPGPSPARLSAVGLSGDGNCIPAGNSSSASSALRKDGMEKFPPGQRVKIENFICTRVVGNSEERSICSTFEEL
ncbi:hypothetical protein AVEN_16587-1 [Araneus ventricosus]|uniref:Uncharacterized protein n=1 Tax=Araneus ventricosus TaxID=182803 RepID=A0A4Y2JRG6_ARAVE|nr:hypothetical protein AVEN_16587-1 [Araneus ventricosus]